MLQDNDNSLTRTYTASHKEMCTCNSCISLAVSANISAAVNINCCYSLLFTVVIHCCYSILVQFATAANLTATAAANITAAVTLGRLACCAAIRDEENRHDRHRNLTFNLPVAYHIDSASHNGV